MKKNLYLLLAAIVTLVSCTQKCITGRISVSGGASLYYEEKGSGTPLILLHGHSLDIRMWDFQFDEFARYYRTIRFDFRGYGKSSEQTECFQFTHMDDLLTLMDSLHISKAHIVGLSMGSFIAGDLLAIHPERVLSCVMASGGIRLSKGPSEPMDSTESAQRDIEIAALKAKGVDVMKREWLDGLVAGGGSRRESIREPLRRMIGDWSAWQPLHKEVRLIWGKDAWRSLKAKCPEVPVLMITGGEGRKENKPYHPRELDYLPNGHAIVVPDCGHMLNMEQPEAFNEMVLDFCSGTSCFLNHINKSDIN